MTGRRHVFVFTGLVVAVMGVAMCASMAGSKTEERPPRDFVRMVIAFELQRVHWKAFTPSAGDESIGVKDLVDQIGTGCVPEKLDYSWTVKYIPRSPGIQAFKGVNASSQEEAAIAELAAAGNEVWRESSDGTWNVVSALRTESVCHACHSRQTAVAVERTGDQPIGYVSIELSRKLNDK